MSRHEIPGRKLGTTVAVGWDQPMLTFFVQVYDPSAEEGPSVWLGGKPRELYDLDDLKRAIRRHADLTPELVRTLYRDRDEGRM